MQRLGERFMYCLPLVVAVLQGCSSDPLPASAGTGGAGGSDAGIPSNDAGNGADGSGNPAGTVMVNIPVGAVGLGPGAYTPNPATVTAGSTVMWMNNDTVAHTATSTTGVWDSGIILPGGSFSHVFSTTGTYPYFCAIHGAASMSGAIIVE